MDMPEHQSSTRIYGDWYDNESKTYLSIAHDNTYIMGYGLNVENTGGTCTIDDQQIILHINYTLVDGKKEDIPNENKEDIVLLYSFSNDNRLIIETNNGKIYFEKINNNENQTLSAFNLKGLWKNLDWNESIRFDENGDYTKISSGGEEHGQYTLKDETLILQSKDKDITYDFSFVTDNRIELKVDNKSIFYEKMGD